ncbi:hypothetical protein K438DRAFT_1758089 [Mycena galopus ATCC 62051]|nr:hypothetical protein K438DRAFT_1758089 [Mycena galopus ATCC 62051]
MSVRSNYYPLSAEDAEEQTPDFEPSHSPQIPSRRVLFLIIFSETLLLLFCTSKPPNIPDPRCLPAQDAVEYGVTPYAITGEDPLFQIHRVLIHDYDPTVHIEDDIVILILHQEMS